MNEGKQNTALLRVLQIFERYTDENHLLTHNGIVAILEKEFQIKIERKAVGRYISILNQAGNEIITTPKGSYLISRKFEDSELKLLIDGVLSSRYINSTQSKQLIEKLSSLSTEYFKPRIANVHSILDWSKSNNSALFYNVDVIDEAISRKTNIKFSYNKYGADKKLHHVATHIVSPFQMILHNQRYFLMAYEHKWTGIRYFRIDRITKIRMLDEPAIELQTLSGFENGIDYRRFSSGLPYMFSDNPEIVKFEIAGEWMIDQIVDWFGYDFNCESVNGKLVITVNVSLNAMEYWVMQYINYVKVLSPNALIDRIRVNLKAASTKYDL